MNTIASNSIREEAAAWFARMQSDARTDADAAAFDSWRSADPRHEATYARLAERWSGAGRFAESPAVLAARQEALASSVARPVERRWWKTALPVAASVAVLAVALGLVFSVGDAPAPSLHQTAVGEKRSVTLDDGSVIQLNTATSVTVAYDDTLRAIVLQDGQAHFEVAKDVNRPFRVTAGDTVITALGTAFDVRRNAETVVVTLIEGRVEVSEEPVETLTKVTQPAAAMELVAGQQVAHQPTGGFTDVTQVDVVRATAWQKGRLIFEDDLLFEVVEEVNRYSPDTIEIGDNSLRTLRVSGVFRTGRSDKVIAALEQYFGIQARYRPDGTTVLLAAESDEALPVSR